MRFNLQTDRLRVRDKDHYYSTGGSKWAHWQSSTLSTIDEALRGDMSGFSRFNSIRRVELLSRIRRHMQAVITEPVEPAATAVPEAVVVRLQRVLREGLTVEEAADLAGCTTSAAQRHLRRLGWESACPVVDGKEQRNQRGTLRRLAGSGGKPKIKTGRRSRATKAEMEARRAAEAAS